MLSMRYMKIMEDRKAAFSRALRYFIENGKNITQTRISKATGIKQGMISGMKNGTRRGTEESRRAIADYFGKPYEEFLDIGQRLLDGESAIVLAPSEKPPDNNITTLTEHQNILKYFQNQELALEVNKKLIELEKQNPNILQEVLAYLAGRSLDGVPLSKTSGPQASSSAS